MRQRRWLAVLAAIPLCGCVTTKMNKGLDSLVGRDIDYAVNRIGYPDATQNMLGDTLYIWSSSRSGVLPMPVTQTTSGMIGSTPVYGQTTGTAYVPANFACTIKLAVGPDRVIKRWQWEGNMGGCQRYASRLTGD